MNTQDQSPEMSQEVTLDTPVVRGDTRIESVRVRKPRSGELRGLKLFDLMQQDVDQVRKALPRVTMPSLTQEEVDQLEAGDFVALGSELALFFMQKGSRPDSRTG